VSSSDDTKAPDDANARAAWSQRWSAGQTAFHEGAPNELLAAHVARIETKPKARIVVPLSGKSFDLRWLAARGHEVVGIEFVADAVSQFFDEWKQTPVRSVIGGMQAASAGGVTLVCGDMLAVSPDALGRFDVVYDRAALVALEPSVRARYVEVCRALLADDGVTLLIALSYDQTKAPGPPFSVDAKTVRELYAPRAVEALASRSVTTSPRLIAAGVASLEESAYRIG
jgi:thiopurine S-methyltransferase